MPATNSLSRNLRLAATLTTLAIASPVMAQDAPVVEAELTRLDQHINARVAPLGIQRVAEGVEVRLGVVSNVLPSDQPDPAWLLTLDENGEILKTNEGDIIPRAFATTGPRGFLVLGKNDADEEVLQHYDRGYPAWEHVLDEAFIPAAVAYSGDEQAEAVVVVNSAAEYAPPCLFRLRVSDGYEAGRYCLPASNLDAGERHVLHAVERITSEKQTLLVVYGTRFVADIDGPIKGDYAQVRSLRRDPWIGVFRPNGSPVGSYSQDTRWSREYTDSINSTTRRAFARADAPFRSTASAFGGAVLRQVNSQLIGETVHTVAHVREGNRHFLFAVEGRYDQLGEARAPQKVPLPGWFSPSHLFSDDGGNVFAAGKHSDGRFTVMVAESGVLTPQPVLFVAEEFAGGQIRGGAATDDTVYLIITKENRVGLAAIERCHFDADGCSERPDYYQSTGTRR